MLGTANARHWIKSAAHVTLIRDRAGAMQVHPKMLLQTVRLGAWALACLLLTASTVAAQDDGVSAAPPAQSESGMPWWIIPVMGGGGAVVGFGTGATVGLVAYGNTCESCWGGGDAWWTGGLIGAGIGAAAGVITSTIIVLATTPSKSPQATPVIVASPEHAYAGVRVTF
jgi:hypothetical protein